MAPCRSSPLIGLPTPSGLLRGHPLRTCIFQIFIRAREIDREFCDRRSRLTASRSSFLPEERSAGDAFAASASRYEFIERVAVPAKVRPRAQVPAIAILFALAVSSMPAAARCMVICNRFDAIRAHGISICGGILESLAPDIPGFERTHR